MATLAQIDAEALIDEISRYLEAVDEFRALRCEPTWRAEPATLARLAESTAPGSRVEKTAH